MSERLRFETRGVLRRLEQRAVIFRAIREHFVGEGFLEVETPSMVPSPGLDLHLDAFEVERRYLITSPEYQMKRLLAGGATRIFQLCRCYRRNEIGANHEPEFTMLEWYRSSASAREIMDDTAQLSAAAARAIHGSHVAPFRGESIDWTPPWPEITVAEAFDRYAGIAIDDALRDEEQFFRILIERIEPELGRGRPTFLTRWPASMASLARLCDDDDRYAARFEAYVAGIELCNGFDELVDPVEQRTRLERDQQARSARGLPVYPIDERFLAALEEGIPPSGGNALGVDRLVMLLLDAKEIGDVVAFPNATL